MKTEGAVLAVLFGKGGLGDVGRHAILAALERDDVASVKVFTRYQETLQERNWNCGCSTDHNLSAGQLARVEIFPVSKNLGSTWNDLSASHFQGVSAVVSCLGTRQPFLGERHAKEGSIAVVKGMMTHSISRVVSITSIGLGDDYPSMEFHFAGKVMDALFSTLCRREARDLVGSEETYEQSDLDYLLVRPTGLGEDVLPTGECFVQNEKHKDVVGTNISKMDCGRFMVEEALRPTRHRTAIVVGGDPEKDGALIQQEKRNQTM